MIILQDDERPCHHALAEPRASARLAGCRQEGRKTAECAFSADKVALRYPGAAQ